MSDSSAQRPFIAGPAEEGLASYSMEGKRRWIEPVLQGGRYLRRRMVIGYALILLFLSAPHLPINGNPAIFLDIKSRLFHLFGFTFHPTDNLLLVFLGMLAVITLFSATALFGRIWCGYGCPQPVYLELVFRPIENWIEGPPAVRRARRDKPAGRARRVVKWAIYLVLTHFLALTVLSYFVGWSRLTGQLWGAPAEHPALLFLVSVLNVAFFVDFTAFREHCCTFLCPYGRLQTVLYDKDTVIVGYDSKRGEPRGAKAGGDCIDCKRCVHACPTGIDIRRGLQMECIGCAQCVDTCDVVMKKVHRSPGLIRYTSLNELEGAPRRFLRRRVVGYALIWTALAASFLYLLSHRSFAEADFLRAAQEPYRELPSGDVANMMRLHLTNLQDVDQDFEVSLLGPEQGRLAAGQQPFVVGPQEVETLNLAITLPRSAFSRGRAEAVLRVKGSSGFERDTTLKLLGPYQ